MLHALETSYGWLEPNLNCMFGRSMHEKARGQAMELMPSGCSTFEEISTCLRGGTGKEPGQDEGREQGKSKNEAKSVH